MAGRAAMIWVGGLAAALATIPARAADLPAPPAPPDFPTGPVVAFQRPVDPPPSDRPPPPPDPLAPFRPQLPSDSEVILPNGARVNLPSATRQLIRFGTRYGMPYNAQSSPDPADKDRDRWIITGGVIVNVVYLGGPQQAQPQEVEFATDNAVIWVKGAKGRNITSGLSAGGDGTERTEVEFFLAGNVVIRTLSADAFGGRAVEQVFRAHEIYYDVSRNRAVALGGDLEMKVAGLPDSFRLRGREIWQLGPNEWRAFEAAAYSSKRPADPALLFTSEVANLTQQERVRTNIFGIPYRDVRTGALDYGTERILTNRRARVRIFDTPILFFPRTRTEIDEPLGPLTGVGFGNDNIFGTQVYTTWDLHKLFALRPPTGHRWVLYADYLSDRGPAIGSAYDYLGPNLFGYGGPHAGLFRFYGIHDEGVDVLGGDRGQIDPHPPFRYRLQWRHNQDLFESGLHYLRWMAQVENFSDRDFFEQYYKYEFDTGPNKESFAHLYGASGNAGGSFLVKGRLDRDWITETEWWPRADGYLLGETFLRDRLIYSAQGSAGYARLLPAEAPDPVLITDQRVDTARFNLQQKLTAPFDLGPVRLAPYGILDLTHYTEDLTGESRGRFYGGGGAKASIYLSRLYPDAASELFNVRGLFHKINLEANYYNAYSDTPFFVLPQLDRLADDVTDYTYRLARLRQNDEFNPAGDIIREGLVPGPAGQALATSPLYDPQLYAIRRLVTNRIDTLGSVQRVELATHQRLQTKRGFPGAEHIVDWLILDLSMSVFPEPDRDNFGEATAFYEYFAQWNVGDRTALWSSGWYDPHEFGARYLTLGAAFSRPDGTTFSLSYRHTDPLESRLLTLTSRYQLSRKYSVNVVTSYDFGLNQSLANQVSFARVGTDMTLLFGFTYNALVNNFGVQFAIVPNVVGLALARPVGVTAPTSMFGTPAALGGVR